MSTTTPSAIFSIASLSAIYCVLGEISFSLIGLALSHELLKELLFCTAAAVASAKRLHATKHEKQRRATAQAIARLVAAEVESQTTAQITRLDDARSQFERQRRASVKLVARRIFEEVALTKENEHAAREAREATERAEQEAREAAKRAKQEEARGAAERSAREANERATEEARKVAERAKEEEARKAAERAKQEEARKAAERARQQEARRATERLERQAAEARTAQFAEAEAARHRQEAVREKQTLDEATAASALQKALPREILHLNPLGSDFTCVGLTKKNARCRQRMISTENKYNGQKQWRTMISNDPGKCFEMPALRELAWALLCPRWHNSCQVDLVARDWHCKLAEARQALKVLKDVKARGAVLDGDGAETGHGGAGLFGSPPVSQSTPWVPSSSPSTIFGGRSVSVESSPSVFRGGLFASATSSPGQASTRSGSSICSDETPSLRGFEAA